MKRVREEKRILKKIKAEKAGRKKIQVLEKGGKSRKTVFYRANDLWLRRVER